MHLRKRPIQNRQRLVNLFLGCGEWRRNPNHVAVQATFPDQQSAGARLLEELRYGFGCWFLSFLIQHHLDALHQAFAPHFAAELYWYSLCDSSADTLFIVGFFRFIGIIVPDLPNKKIKRSRRFWLCCQGSIV